MEFVYCLLFDHRERSLGESKLQKNVILFYFFCNCSRGIFFLLTHSLFTTSYFYVLVFAPQIFFLILQELVNSRYNQSGVENPWFVFGGSYAGALSAWFRLKFPHLTCGSLASSAVVQAIYNFTDFDKQVTTHFTNDSSFSRYSVLFNQNKKNSNESLD